MMNELIVVFPNDKNKKFILKNEDRSCEIEILKRGVFKGIIEKIYSNGRYDIRLIEKTLEAKE